jgi:very-short-patch-repair endonuclease
MRWAPTPSEARLWEALRGRQLGALFRRQVGIGSYIADFCAQEARLVVEVDGGCHVARERADARRDRALGRAGYRVLRVEAELVHRDLAGVLARLRAALHKPA